MMISLIITIVCFFLFNIFINFINYNEENIINIKVRDKIFIFISFFLIFRTIRIDNIGMTFFGYCLFALYLITTSYIDLKTKSVYTFINIICVSIIIIFIIPMVKDINFENLILGLIITFTFALINKIISYFVGVGIVADGDIEVFLISSLILSTKSSLYYSNELLSKIILNNSFLLLMFSIFIGGIVAIYLIVFKGKNGDQTSAFTPCIAIASLVILLFI